MPHSLLEKPAGRLWATSIRHPLSRLVSAFEYFGRWGLKLDTCKAVRDGNMSADAARPLREWIEDSKSREQECGSSRVWGCSSNCYVKWFAGLGPGSGGGCEGATTSKHKMGRTVVITDADLDTAVANARRFDLIVSVEHIADRGYLDRVLGALGKPPGGTFPHKLVFCQPEFAAGNRRYPYTISREDAQRMAELNAWDLRFYDIIAREWGVHVDYTVPTHRP